MLPAGVAAAPPRPQRLLKSRAWAPSRAPSLPPVSRDSAPLLRGGPGPAMVRLHVKRGGESQFLLEAPGSARLAELAPLAARIHNGRLKVQRLCLGTAGGRGGREQRPGKPWQRAASALNGAVIAQRDRL